MTSPIGIAGKAGQGVLDRLRRMLGIGGPDSEVSPAEATIQQPELRPTATTLHLFIDDGLLHVDGDRLALAIRDGSLRHFRAEELRGLSIHGNAGATSPAIRFLVQHGIPLVWRDAAGRLAAQAMPRPADTLTRKAQYAAETEPARGFQIARELVLAKVMSARGLLRRRLGEPGLLDRLAGIEARIADCPSIELLRGLEGAAAAGYFAVWPKLLPAMETFAFAGRSRRPARDPINALLNYAYAVVAGEAMVAAAMAGLDVFVGFLHAPRAGRPALALDLMEPLRPLVAERAVLRLVNRGEITPADFAPDAGGGIVLSLPVRKRLIGALETRFAEAAPGTPARDYRAALFAEAEELARCLRHREPYACRLRRA